MRFNQGLLIMSVYYLLLAYFENVVCGARVSLVPLMPFCNGVLGLLHHLLLATRNYGHA